MKIIALEEHLTIPSMLAAQGAADDPPAGPDGDRARLLSARLADLGQRRLADMDGDGIDVQVLSVAEPATQGLGATEAVALAREANDEMAAAVAAHPDRFQALATLPTPDPAAAVTELTRAVTELGCVGAMLCGRTGERNVDHPDFAGVWAAAEQLGVPIYIHPASPPPAVIGAYYSGLGPVVDSGLAHTAIGWHYETGLQLLRLIFAGVFDRHPALQVILGHWGEVVLFYAERTAALAGRASLDRPLLDYLRENVSYTAGGILSERYLRWTIEVVGVDRVMFAADYPYAFNGAGASRAFLEGCELEDADREKIAHGNWERLTGAA
jgi:predicted TIM-barrel fold metal-dependent hydrolase